MITILDATHEFIHSIPAVNCASGGKRIEHRPIAVERYRVEGLPEGLDALLVSSDLQGMDRADVPVSQRRQVGHVVAEHLEMLCQQDILPTQERCGVVLAGDLYAVPSLDKRGGLGDVLDVWRTFRSAFAWAVGVGGNHDSFDGECDVAALDLLGGCHGLDGSTVELDGLRFGGVSGVIGSSGKPWRRREKEFVRMLDEVLDERPDIVVLHQGPQAPEKPATSGHVAVTERVLRHEAASSALVICGHVHWPAPLERLPNGCTVLNVDHRVVILQR